VLVLGMVVVVAAGRGWATPKTSSCARFQGWQGGGGNKNPKTSMNVRFGDGGSRQNPENKQSCLLSGLRGWWQWWRRAEGGQNPENEQSCLLLGLGDGGGSQNPKTSICAHFGGGGSSSRQAEGGRTSKTSSRACFQGWQGGGGSKNPKMSTNARFGDGGGRQRVAESRKRAVVLVFGVGRMVVVAAAAGRGQVEP